VRWNGRHILVLSGSDQLWADEAPELTVASQRTSECVLAPKSLNVWRRGGM
jgi:hypothetical protein